MVKGLFSTPSLRMGVGLVNQCVGTVLTQSAPLTLKDLFAENPHTGTREQVIALALGIADAAENLDKTSFVLQRDDVVIDSKIFSKLKVIGEALQKIDLNKRDEVIKKLPGKYSTIHLLCSLKAEELVTAVKSGLITPKMSVRAAEAYVKQVRYPLLAANEEEKSHLDGNEDIILGIHCPHGITLSDEVLLELEESLRIICSKYGVLVSKKIETSSSFLKKQERAAAEIFWRNQLEKLVTLKWFQEKPDNLKKQFNIRTIEELLNTPLRSFTGFLVNAEGGRNLFWEIHGKAYIAKIHLEKYKTDDRAQRHNLNRRINEVLTDRVELAKWRNQMVKQNLFV